MNAPMMSMEGPGFEGPVTSSSEVVICLGEQEYGGSVHLERYCSEHGLPFYEITKPYGGKFLRRAHEFLCRVDGARVVGDGFLVLPGGGIVTRGLTCSNYWRAIQIKLNKVGTRVESEHIDEAVLCWGNENWGHWFFQFLMRMTLVLGDRFARMPVLVSNDVPARYLDWLPRLGFHNIVQADEWVEVDRLWVPSVVTYRGHYEDYNCYLSVGAVHAMRERLTAAPGGFSKNVFVSRRKVTWRKILNEDELIAALGSNWQVLFMEELTVEEQISAISHAEQIIMSAGASGSITMLAQKSCRIIELIQPKLMGTFGPVSWAHILGQSYTRIDGVPKVEPKGVRKEIDWDYTIDVGDVMRAFNGERIVVAA